MNLKQILSERLEATVKQCLVRCLFQSANWALEQLQGLGENVSEESDSMVDLSWTESVKRGEIPYILQSSCHLSGGHYIRGAHCLQFVASAANHPSNLALFLFAYSKYLGGEKEKWKSGNETKSSLRPKSSPFTSNKAQSNSKNPYLPELINLLHRRQLSGVMDGFLLHLLAVLLRDYSIQYGKPVSSQLPNYNGNYSMPEISEQNTKLLFMQSLAMLPWNWSCWLDFAKFCIDKRLSIPSWEEISQCGSEVSDSTTRQAGRIIYTFFLAYIYLERHRGDLSLQVLEKLHRIFPSSIHVLTQVSVSYYSQRLYDQAEECFLLIRKQDPYRLQHLDTYSNILYVKEKMAELSILAHDVMQYDKYSPEVCCIVGNYYSLKNHHDKAVLYFQRALRLDETFLSAWTLMGHEFMELRNTSAAVQCYRHAIRWCETDYRAWYGLGQTYEMLHLYQYSVYYFKRAASLRPTDARMWSAVGNCLVKLGLKGEAMSIYERAVAAGDTERIATKDLARLYRDDNHPAKAAELYYKYLCNNLFRLVLREDNTTTLPTTVESFASDFSDFVSKARPSEDLDLLIEPEQAECLLFLANYFFRNQFILAANYCCTLLSGFHGPEGDEAKILSKEIRRTQHSLETTSRQSKDHFTSTSQPPQVSDLFSPLNRLSYQSEN